MTMNPYEVLGVSPQDSDDAIKKAYRQLCKRYHPDLNPNDAVAEAKFKEVQSAYDDVGRIRRGEAPASSGSNAWQGQSPFSGYGYTGQQSRSTDYYQAAQIFMAQGYYAQARSLLDNMSERPAQWYYYSAQAYAGMGHYATAREHAAQAHNMAPDNIMFYRLHKQMQSGFGQRRAGRPFSLLRAVAMVFLGMMFLRFLFYLLFW